MSSLKRILVRVDGSDTSARGLRFGVERAKRHNARLAVAYAVNRTSVAIAMSNPYGYVDPTPMLDAIDDEADAVLETGLSLAKAFDVAGPVSSSKDLRRMHSSSRQRKRMPISPSWERAGGAASDGC